jgi:hypothetical protein
MKRNGQETMEPRKDTPAVRLEGKNESTEGSKMPGAEMNMAFRAIDRRDLDIESWERIAENGSFFHTHYWADVCYEGLDTSIAAVFLCAYAEDRLVGGMPAIITQKYGMRSLHAMPYGTYGEAVFSGNPGNSLKDGFYGRLDEYIKKNRFSKVTITDFNRSLSIHDEPVLKRLGCFTHIISLNGRGEYHPPDKKIEVHIRKGLRADTEIVEVKTAKQLDEFYNLYNMTERRHGRRKSLYSKRFFSSILDNLANSGKLVWISMLADNVMIGSSINFIHGETLFNWQTVSNYEKRHFKPNHILLDEAIRIGISAGVKEINLGASPPDAHGLIDYKERWGGVRIDYDFYYSSSWVRRLLNR